MCELDVCADDAPGPHGCGVGLISLLLRLVLSGVSMRGATRVLAILDEVCGWSIDIPHWTTGRLWLMRLGHAQLTMPLAQADDWAWFVDHSVQIGQEKCLVILGIRLSDLPKPGVCLQHQDMRLIALAPRASWTQYDVHDALEGAVKRTGVPRVIVDDHGSELHGGVRLFQETHRNTKEVYDIKHKAACVLKRRLQQDVRWQEFQRQAGQARSGVRQTEMAFLAPPLPKDKARFMNLEPQLAWAEGILDILRDPPAEVLAWVKVERLQEKFGWLRAHGNAVAEWSHWQQVVNIAVQHVNHHGITRTTAKEISKQMPRLFAHASTTALVKELLQFVTVQAKPLRPGERFPGSTEVLESCFGKMKELEKQQSRGGFTNLIISFGALMATTTAQAIKAALQHSRTIDVKRWCRDHLGTTLFGKRKLAFAASATKAG
jgi:hypothetical protein